MNFKLNNEMEYYIIDKNKVALFSNGSLFNLEGDDVELYLIPMLSSADFDYESNELMNKWNWDERKMEEFISQLKDIGLVIPDTDNEIKITRINHHELSSKNSVVNELIYKSNQNINISILYTDERFLLMNGILKSWNYNSIKCFDISIKSSFNEIRSFIKDSDIICFCGDIRDSWLASRVCEISNELGKPSIYLHIDDFAFEVGPFVIPHESGCFSCYKARTYESNKSTPLLIKIQKYISDNYFVANVNKRIDLVYEMAVRELALEIYRYSLHQIDILHGPCTFNTVDRHDLITNTIDHIEFLKLPFCKSCKDKNNVNIVKPIYWL